MWSHSHLSPTDTLYPAGRYGPAFAELNSELTPLLTRWCVRKGLSTRFQTGVSSCPPNVSKTPTPVLYKLCKWGHTEECTPSPILDQLFRAHPRQSTQNVLSCRFFTPRTPRTTIPIPTHASRSTTYIHAYIYSRAIKDMIIKEGSARFIIMHLN
jgi:hypothetical protein